MGCKYEIHNKIKVRVNKDNYGKSDDEFNYSLIEVEYGQNKLKNKC